MFYTRHERTTFKERSPDGYFHPIHCSICEELDRSGAHSWGFMTPMDKSFNSSWWFYFVGKNAIYYLTFTWPFKKRPNQ